MLEKINLTIKDLIIYFIPGVITLFSLIYLNGYNFKKIEIIDNTSLVFLSIIFSFLFGFIFSQLQIILFYIFYKRIDKDKKYLLLSHCSIHAEFKNKIADQIKITFGLSSEFNVQDVFNDKDILDLCDNYVRTRGNAEAYSPIERDSYLSSFSIAIFLPIVLGLLSYIKSLKDGFESWGNYVLPISLIIIIIPTIGKAAINFKKGRTCKIFEQFLIYSLKPELNKASG